MSIFRVFVTRHFIDVTWFDVEAETSRKARNKATKAAQKIRTSEQSRAVACDNGWIADEPVTIPVLGHHGDWVDEVHEVILGAFQPNQPRI